MPFSMVLAVLVTIALSGCSQGQPVTGVSNQPALPELSPVPLPGARDDLARMVLQTPVVDRMAGPGPAAMTLEEARGVVPFSVEPPEYLPQGWLPEPLVTVLLQPAGEGEPYRPVGIRQHYRPVVPKSAGRQRVISLEQSLLNRNPVHAEGNKRVVPLGTRWADVWETTDAAGNPLVFVAWEELGNGTASLLLSTESEEETMKVAWSVH